MNKHIWVYVCRECKAEKDENGYGLIELPNDLGLTTLYCFCGGVVDLMPVEIKEDE